VRLQHSPDPLAEFKEPTSKGRGKGRGRQGRERKGRGRGGEGHPGSCLHTLTWNPG